MLLMIILSWDVGITNLSWCIVTLRKDGYEIFDWNVINFIDSEDEKHIIKCSGLLKNKKPCTKNAKFKQDTYYCCSKHLNSDKPKETLAKDKVNIKKLTLQYLAEHLAGRLDSLNILSKWPIDVIIIENQPKIASASIKHTMDFLLCYLTIRLIDLKKKTKVITISPKRKLSVYNGPSVECNIKDPHSRNKFLGVSYCSYMLKNELTHEEAEPYYIYVDWLKFFESIKKKDDLADSFLQGAWYLKNKSLR